MVVIHSLILIFTVSTVLVECFPQNQQNINFPDENEDISDSSPEDRQGFRPRQPGFRPRQQGPRPQQGFRPPGNSRPEDFPGNFGSGNTGNNFRPQGFQSGNNFGSGQGNDFRPQGTQSGNNFGSGQGNDFRPQGTQSGNNFGSGQGSDFRPSNSRPGSPNGNNFNSNTQGNNSQSSTSTSTTTAAPGETTTRIPPRDPTNRIVYIVSCPCQFTRQYTPVCGTDGQTYGNLSVLRCAQQCGTGKDEEQRANCKKCKASESVLLHTSINLLASFFQVSLVLIFQEFYEDMSVSMAYNQN